MCHKTPTILTRFFVVSWSTAPSQSVSSIPWSQVLWKLVLDTNSLDLRKHIVSSIYAHSELVTAPVLKWAYLNETANFIASEQSLLSGYRRLGQIITEAAELETNPRLKMGFRGFLHEFLVQVIFMAPL